MLGDVASWQTVVVPLMVAAGVGRTVTAALPEMEFEQLGVVWY